jgi:hypothetical protein
MSSRSPWKTNSDDFGRPIFSKLSYRASRARPPSVRSRG